MFKGQPNKVVQVYQVIFIAFHEAIIKRNLIISNHESLQTSLKGIFEAHLKALNSDEKWTAEERQNLASSVFGVISKNFKPRSGTDSNLGGWVSSLENILNESKTEQVCYDFKLGFTQISGGNGEFSERVLCKIVKTLTAMTNSKPGDCYVIVGVADSESDAQAHDFHYDSKHVKYKDFFITGIDAEAEKYHKSIGDLEQKILQLIDSQPTSAEIITTIKSNMVSFAYQDKQILLFKASRGERPAIYDEKYYRRSMSHISEIGRQDEYDFFKEFEKESSLGQKTSI